MYWKYKGKDEIYWSNNKENNKDILFSNKEEYFKHRIKNNYKRDWSKISEFSDFTISEFETNDFYDNLKSKVKNKVKNNFKNKGMYWKFKNEGTIYWSNDLEQLNKTITFIGEKDYFDHRSKNNLRRDWSNIKEYVKVKDIKIKINNIKVNNLNNDKKKEIKEYYLHKKNGMYWKFKNDDSIFWSNDKRKLNKDEIFITQKDYFDHRHRFNYKRDWSNIKEIEGVY